MASLRERWKQAKANAAAHLDMKNAAAKENLGPLLDKFEAEKKAYNESMKKWALKPDPAKQMAARQKVKVASAAAGGAAAKYAQALEQIEKHSNGATQNAVSVLRTFLTIHIITPLNNASNGNF